MYETLLNKEERVKSLDMGNYFRVPADIRDLNYDKYFVEGDNEISAAEEYTSHNTERLNVEQVKEKLLTLDFIRDEIEVTEAAK